MPYFLLYYDNDEDSATVLQFDERVEAYDALKEGTIGKPPEDELVLFITDSEATLRRTHPRYFYAKTEIDKQKAAGIMQKFKTPVAQAD